MYGDHPPAFGHQHPWIDPLAPQDLLNPRPDADLVVAGSLAPSPQDFPFTEQGRRDYYAAVNSAAQQQMMMQQQQTHMQAARAARLNQESTARALEHQRKVAFLLLAP
jgi:hypothetical protein